MPQLLWGLQFETHCHPVLLLTIPIDISKNNCSFAPLQRFRAKMRELHRASQGAPCSVLKLGVYCSIILNLCQQSLPSELLNQGNLTPTCFWRAIDHLKFSYSLASDQEIFVLLNHPNQMIELRPSQEASQLISFTCLAMEPTQGATQLSENLFRVIKADSCAKQYLQL